MRTQQTNLSSVYTGFYNTIKLDLTPDPPLSERERYKHKANYPTTMAKLHVYLDGKEATQFVPSGYLLFILDHLLVGVPSIIDGKSITASWLSDPWQFDLRGVPSQNRVLITLHIPGGWVAMRDVSVPLDQFGDELISLGKKWMKYLDDKYHQETTNLNFNKQYLQLEQYIAKAKEALIKYRK